MGSGGRGVCEGSISRRKLCLAKRPRRKPATSGGQGSAPPRPKPHSPQQSPDPQHHAVADNHRVSTNFGETLGQKWPNTGHWWWKMVLFEGVDRRQSAPHPRFEGADVETTAPTAITVNGHKWTRGRVDSSRAKAPRHRPAGGGSGHRTRMG